MPGKGQRFEVEQGEDNGEEFPCAREFGSKRREQGTRPLHFTELRAGVEYARMGFEQSVREGRGRATDKLKGRVKMPGPG